MKTVHYPGFELNMPNRRDFLLLQDRSTRSQWGSDSPAFWRMRMWSSSPGMAASIAVRVS